MKEVIKAAGAQEVRAGKLHDFPDLGSVLGVVAVTGAVLAGRLRLEWTVHALEDRVLEEGGAIAAEDHRFARNGLDIAAVDANNGLALLVVAFAAKVADKRSEGVEVAIQVLPHLVVLVPGEVLVEVLFQFGCGGHGVPRR